MVDLVDPETSVALRRQVERLVQLQDAMDDALSGQNAGGPLRAFIPDALTTMIGNAVEGTVLADHVLPFLDYDGDDGIPGQVPVNRVLGTSWRWRSLYSPDAQVDEMVEYFTDHARAELLGKDSAKVTLIEPLGLYVAHEGKNRVRFLREAGERTMAARVWTHHYPAPERIQLYRGEGFDTEVVFAVLDGREISRLRMPTVTLPLLKAYGVADIASWPTAWPSAVRVAEACAAARKAPAGRRTADLDSLKAELEQARAGEELVDASVLDLADVRPRLKWWLGYLGACLAAGLVSIPFVGANAALIAGTLGACLGLVAHTGKAIRVKQKLLAPSR